MFSAEILGAWFAAFLTLAIFSYLFDDNPFYKAAEHIFVGVSAGYWAAQAFWAQVQPNLFGRLWPKIAEGTDQTILEKIWYGIYDFMGMIAPSGYFPAGGIEGHDQIRLSYLIPFILGIFMILRLVPKVGWLARWALAYIVGMAAGLRFYGYLNSDVIEQAKAAVVDFSGNWVVILNGIIVIIGTITGLLYFFFSREHKGLLGKASKIGIYFLMISFGASFGFAVMGRISLLIGRFNDLIRFKDAEFSHATYWILGAMIVLLAVWAFQKKDETEKLSA